MPPILESRGATKRYRMGETDVLALRGVDVTIPRGELAVVAGPSGSGKSTLLHLFGCLDLPDAGTIDFDGIDTAAIRGRARTELLRRRVGFVFQSHALVPVLSALENVEYPLVVAGLGRDERRRRSLACLDEVGLAGRASHRPSQLSGGEQQRVALARALVHAPDVVLADEPTAHLDSESGARVLDLLEAHRASHGTTVVVATHDPEVMRRASLRIDLRDGRVAARP